RITYSAESQALETAGGIAQALPFFGEAPFLVVNGDIWCDWNPSQAQAIAMNLTNDKKAAWLLLVDNPPHHPQGDFRLDVASGQVFANGHEGDHALLTFAGIGI